MPSRFDDSYPSRPLAILRDARESLISDMLQLDMSRLPIEWCKGCLCCGVSRFALECTGTHLRSVQVGKFSNSDVFYCSTRVSDSQIIISLEKKFEKNLPPDRLIVSTRSQNFEFVITPLKWKPKLLAHFVERHKHTPPHNQK